MTTSTVETSTTSVVCGALGGTYSCQRESHGPSVQHKTVVGPTVGKPGWISFLYWGGSEGEKFTSKRVVF